MNIPQKSDLRALEQTLLMLTQNATIVDDLPNANATITVITDSVALMYQIDGQVQLLSKQSADNKTVTRKQLEDMTMQLTARGVVYAIQTGQKALEERLDTRLSVLKKQSDVPFRDFAQAVYDTLFADIANIAAIYRITAADLTAYQTLINDFTAIMPGPNNRQTQIKALNQRFADLLTEAKTNAKLLDKLVDMVRYDQAVFYKNYYTARKPKKAASNPRALVFKIIDATTNLPLAKANATFTAQKTGKTLTFTTNKNGTIVVQNMTEGIYEGTASETAYIAADYTIPILNGKTFHKTILLEQDPTANRDTRG
jgi:hypothetical protein